MQMENCYFYLDKKGKIVWYIKIFYLLILICEYLFGKNVLWNWDSEYLRSEAGITGNIKFEAMMDLLFSGFLGRKIEDYVSQYFLNYWHRNWNEISLWPFLEIMFFGNMFFWSLISDSIEWAHDSRFCSEKIG